MFLRICCIELTSLVWTHYFPYEIKLPHTKISVYKILMFIIARFKIFLMWYIKLTLCTRYMSLLLKCHFPNWHILCGYIRLHPTRKWPSQQRKRIQSGHQNIGQKMIFGFPDMNIVHSCCDQRESYSTYYTDTLQVVKAAKSPILSQYTDHLKCAVHLYEGPPFSKGLLTRSHDQPYPVHSLIKKSHVQPYQVYTLVKKGIIILRCG